MPDPLRVLYVWDADYPWDIRTEKVCRSLVEAGHPVAITARNRARRPEVEALPEGTVYRLRSLDWLPKALDDASGLPAFLNPRWIGHLGRTADEFRPDVIVVRDVPLAPTAIWEARRRRIPVVLDMAENYPAMIADVWKAGRQRPLDIVVRNPKAVRAVERYCLARVDSVLVVVEESRDRLIQLGADSARIEVVSNTPPRSRAVGPDREPVDGRLTVVYLGMMELTRGVGELITAAARLRGTIPGLSVRLIGDGRDRALLEALARDLGVLGNPVEFLGFVPNADALAIVAGADIGVVPHHADESWDTTIPNKLFDYMAAGLAVVTSDAVPAARVVRETGAGTVFRSEDAADCARALAELASPAIRRAAGAAGRRAIRDRYNWELDTDRLLQAIHRVTGRTQ
ncbi:MAG: glycosyltransferase family 4 protein [Gemmatimonadetes bacterium]|nr:glycosyltransferase family 4 protein [Gemmatimonadota bacterium]